MQNHIEDGTDDIPLTEKVDVYSLGNILWSLLTNTSPWVKDKKVMDELRPRVARGEMPNLPSKIANSTDPTTVAIKNAMFKCLRINPEERASAGEVAHDLKMALKEVKRLETEEKERKKEADKAAAKLAKEEEKKEVEAEEAAAKAFDEEGAALAPQLLARREQLMSEEEQKKKEAEEAVAKAFDEEGAALAPELLARRELLMDQAEQKKEAEAEEIAAKAIYESTAEELMVEAEQKKEDRDDAATETEPMEVINE